MDAATARLRARTRQQIHSCLRCDLRSTCTRPVAFTGPSPARLAIIGEAPGAEEDRAGQPFIGSSGKLIRSLLSENRVDPATCMILNAVCCRPPGNRSPKTKELADCRANLDAQIELARPQFILLLGATALLTVRPDLKVTQVHGRPFVGAVKGKQQPPNPYERTPVYFPTFHPAAGLRDVEVKKKLRADVGLLAAIMREPNHLGLWPTSCVKCGAEGWKQPIDLIAYCEKHLPSRNPKIPEPPGTRERQEMFV